MDKVVAEGRHEKKNTFEVRVAMDCELCGSKSSAMPNQIASTDLEKRPSCTQDRLVLTMPQATSSASSPSEDSFHSALSEVVEARIGLNLRVAEPSAQQHSMHKRKSEAEHQPDDAALQAKRQKIEGLCSEPTEPKEGELSEEGERFLESLVQELEDFKERRAHALGSNA